MSVRKGPSSKLCISIAVLCMVLISSVLVYGQTPSTQPTGVPHDWSHRHLVFSSPETEAEAIRNGTYLEWLQIVNNPRYVFQQLKRRLPAQGPAADEVARIQDAARTREEFQAEELAAEQSHVSIGKIKRPVKPTVHNDWSMVLGPSAKVGAGMSPAKFSFSPTAAPNCGNATTPDFVAYNTSVAGSASQASIVAFDNLYSSCTGQVPSVYWAFNTGGAVVTSPVLSSDGSQLAFVQTSGNAQLVLLKWTAKPTGRTVTGSVTSASKNFTVSAGTLTSMDVGAGISGTGIPSGDTIATVTSATAGTLLTAATASHAGEALAITADAGGPDTLTSVGAGSYSACTAPCMTTLSFSGSRADTISSPFYDYGTDTIYVGDASGGLHKFHPVFSGTPAEVGTPWSSPSTTALSSPVFDATSGNVFVGDASGYLYSVNSSGTATKSVELAVSPGIVDGPLVDSSAGRVYIFVPQDFNSTNSSTSPCAAINSGNKTVCNGVIQLPTNFTGSTQFTESVTGVGTTSTLYDGAFDNLYWTTGTGNLYSSAAKADGTPKLMQIPISTGGFSTLACQSGTGLPTNCSAIQCATNIVTMASGAAAGAPVTEICNNGAAACTSSSTDYIFTSVTTSGNLTASGPNKCTGACVYSWTTTTALGASAAPTDGLSAAGGTSAIIIDNTSSTGGASQIYFSTLGTSGTCATSGTITIGGCAVQASQSALQ